MERITNPVDIGMTASPEQLRDALTIVLADDGVDAVIAVSLPPLPGLEDEMAAAIGAAARTRPDKPVLANVLTGPASIGDDERRIPVYRFPEGAVGALARMADRADWLATPDGDEIEIDDVDIEQVRALLIRHFEHRSEGGWLDPAAALEFAALAQLPVLRSIVSADVEGAVAAATELGFPVALKAAAPGFGNRLELGALHLALDDADAVRQAALDMTERLGDRLGGLLVQPMIEQGLDLIAGLTTDDVFGPLVVFGLGGIRAELLLDRVVHSAPLHDQDAHRMVRELRASPLLFGFRGFPSIDVDALESLLARIGWLAETFPEIVELDLNPLVATESGSRAVDFRVRIEPLDLHPEHGLRALGHRMGP